MLYSQIADAFWDSNGVGWRIYPPIIKGKRGMKERKTVIIYRKDLSDLLLDMLKILNEDRKD